jgi:hypothetical protein
LTQEEHFEEKLSCVVLHDDNITMLMNGESGYPTRLPITISKKSSDDKKRIVEDKILDGCGKYRIDYVSEDNLKNRAKEVVDQLYERARVAKKNYNNIAPPAPPPLPPTPLPKELTKEISWEEVADILSTSIRNDEAPKLITFCAMLLAQTNKDQLNIGFQAESTTGKSYIPMQLSLYFPENEIMKIGGASPTSFYHDGGEWDAERKVLVVNLEHKNIIFIDMPHFQLLERLRPLLSHDDKELRYMITDHNQKKGLRTKNVIIKGYPSVFFCSTKTDPDEQEKTRMLLLSPSIDQEKLDESLKLATLREGNPEAYRKKIEEDPKRAWLIKRILGIRQWGIKEIVLPDDGQVVYDRFRKEHLYLIPRYQRDFPRIFSFIKAHVLLNCFNREKIDSHTIMATIVDIDAGFALYKEVELSNELGLSPYIFRIFVDVIAPLLSYDGIGKGVSREEIMRKHYEIRYKTLSPETLKREIIPQLELVGLILQEPDPDDKRKLLIYPTVSTPIISAKLAESNNASSKNYERNMGEHSGVKNSQQQKLSETGGA